MQQRAAVIEQLRTPYKRLHNAAASCSNRAVTKRLIHTFVCIMQQRVAVIEPLRMPYKYLYNNNNNTNNNSKNNNYNIRDIK